MSTQLNGEGRRPIRVGLIGCGNVSRRYLENVASAPELVVIACADAVPLSAATVAAEFGIPAVYTVEQMLACDDIDLILNLTLPQAHAEITLRALAAHKHVYTEKPLAVNLADAQQIVEVAAQLGLRVGSAPDTFLGCGIQKCRSLIEAGLIGVPVSANAFMMNGGPERFHPSPEFLYRHGAGPLMDMGPYYVSALVELLGPIIRVGGLGSMSRATRTTLNGERAGSQFPVETATHVASLLQFASGVLGTFVTSFDVVGTQTPRLEIHGTEGTIVAPAPNTWAGPIALRRAGDDGFEEIEVEAEEHAGFMGMGLVDMARGLLENREPLASGQRGLHVLEVLRGILDSAESGGNFADIGLVEVDGASNLSRHSHTLSTEPSPSGVGR